MVRWTRATVILSAVTFLAGCPSGTPTEADAGETGTQQAAQAADAGAADEAAAPDAASEAEAGSDTLGPPEKDPQTLVPGEGDLYAVFHTTQGDLVARLYEKEAPRTVANFVGLATGQVPFRNDLGEVTTGRFYDGTLFHRVIPRFMIQGGDPTGTGRGGPGYRFEDEAQSLSFSKPGILAMANAGPDTNGSQFFITEVPTPHLNGRHTIFGSIVEGQPVVERIARVRTAGSRPIEPVKIETLEIVRSKTPPKGSDGAAQK